MQKILAFSIISLATAIAVLYFLANSKTGSDLLFTVRGSAPSA